MKPTVLIVDDEKLVRWSLRQRLEEDGCRVVEAETGAAALEAYRKGVDAVLLDFNLPDTDGLKVLASMRSEDPLSPIIMLTAHSSVERAVAAMKLGAAHFAPKPFELDEVAALVSRALEPIRLRQEVARLRGDGDAPPLIGESTAMRRVLELCERVATSPASTVLITGESGTGKDVVAKTIHAHSDRSAAPFMNITCSALPEALLESELFGHEKGAFTDAKAKKVGLLEQASGGTVFLDEIAEMTPALQSKLLRFLEEKAFRRVGGSSDVRPDVRVIAATHKDLPKAIEEGTFRADLYYRLAVLSIAIPPLREREGDIELLAKYFIDRFNREFHKGLRGISSAGLQALELYSWPGNVRELKNAIERAVLLSDGPRLEAGDFEFATPPRGVDRLRLPPNGIKLDDLEREFIVQALERAHGNQTRAAKLLGLTRDQIRYRISKFELTVPEG
ncbi:MAG: sigma-54-dependent Fis family transcriptional regulator [Planctomycetes bacterium]|nr:sigma-54-dependent Fis family transcriptional regulator [Planctomycetota bacterium]